MEAILKNQASTGGEYFAQENILIRLNALPFAFFWVNPQGGYYNSSLGRFVKHKSKFIMHGASDIIGFYKKTFYAFEVKTPTEYKYALKHIDDIYSTHPNNLNKKKLHLWRQKDFIEQVKKNGGNGGFVSSFDDCCKIMGL